MENIELSIILPCYNESKILKNNIIKIIKYLQDISFSSYELVIVNDGSKDSTLDKIIEVKELYPKLIKVVHYKDNKGKGYAIKKGILESNGKYILFMDMDLSTDLSAIKNCLDLAKKENTSIIIGSRRLKESQLVIPQGKLRKFIGTSCKIYTNLKLRLKIKDTQCGFKFFEKDIAKKIANKQIINRWAFDAEMLYIARLNNISIKEIPIIWSNDEDSKVSPFDASIKFILDLSKIKKNKKNYIF